MRKMSHFTGISQNASLPLSRALRQPSLESGREGEWEMKKERVAKWESERESEKKRDRGRETVSWGPWWSVERKGGGGVWWLGAPLCGVCLVCVQPWGLVIDFQAWSRNIVQCLLCLPSLSPPSLLPLHTGLRHSSYSIIQKHRTKIYPSLSHTT